MMPIAFRLYSDGLERRHSHNNDFTWRPFEQIAELRAGRRVNISKLVIIDASGPNEGDIGYKTRPIAYHGKPIP
jgi:hypothetical protein